MCAILEMSEEWTLDTDNRALQKPGSLARRDCLGSHWAVLSSLVHLFTYFYNLWFHPAVYMLLLSAFVSYMPVGLCTTPSPLDPWSCYSIPVCLSEKRSCCSFCKLSLYWFEGFAHLPQSVSALIMDCDMRQQVNTPSKEFWSNMW